MSEKDIRNHIICFLPESTYNIHKSVHIQMWLKLLFLIWADNNNPIDQLTKTPKAGMRILFDCWPGLYKRCQKHYRLFHCPNVASQAERNLSLMTTSCTSDIGLGGSQDKTGTKASSLRTSVHDTRGAMHATKGGKQSFDLLSYEVQKQQNQHTIPTGTMVASRVSR